MAWVDRVVKTRMYYSARCLIGRRDRGDSDHRVRNQIAMVVKSFSRSCLDIVVASLRSRKHFAWTAGIADLENCYANVNPTPARIDSRCWR